MRTHRLVAALAVASLATACGETTMQKAGTGAAGGAVAGAVVGGPIGALVGAGIGGAGGAYRDTVDEKVDQTVGEARQEISQLTDEERAGAAPAAYRSERNRTDTQSVGRAIQPAQSDLTNAEVREAQTALKDLGLYKGNVDGLYGRRTIQAVKEFQTKHNMTRTDGALTEETGQRLQEVAANTGTGGQTDQSPGQPDRNPGQMEQSPDRMDQNPGRMQQSPDREGNPSGAEQNAPERQL